MCWGGWGGGERVLQKQEANQLASHLISQPIRPQINYTKAESSQHKKKTKSKIKIKSKETGDGGVGGVDH